MSLEKQDNQNNNLQKFLDEGRAIANRLFSSEDGRKYARQMLKACHYNAIGRERLSDRELLYTIAQQDFVNAFLINLVDRDVLLDILDNK
jgi:hypothetical protein